MKMKIKRYVVTAADYDSKTPEVRAVCKTEDEAKNFTLEDMREYADKHANEGMVLDDECLRVADNNWIDGNGCEWNIEDVEIEIEDDDIQEFLDKAYNAGYEDCINDNIRNS